MRCSHGLLQRKTRQTNSYDCGPFVAADFVSLIRSDVPSSKSQKDMKEWRATMAARLRALPEDLGHKDPSRRPGRRSSAIDADVIVIDGSP